MRESESIITKRIRNMLDLLKIPHFKHFGGPMAPVGVSDIIGTLPPTGRALFIEVKRPGLTPKEHQQRFLDVHSLAGALAFCATDVETVVRTLADAGHDGAGRIYPTLPKSPVKPPLRPPSPGRVSTTRGIRKTRQRAKQGRNREDELL